MVCRPHCTLRAVALTIAFALAQALVGTRQAADEYIRFELLEPGSGRIRVLHDVTAITPGATEFVTVARPGSAPSDTRVVDRATGESLKWEAAQGRLRIRLREPIPQQGEARLRVEQTEVNSKSYARETDGIRFDRPEGIRRGSVLLPAGYAVTACTVPAQVIAQADGRILVSVMSAGPSPQRFELRAKAGLAPFVPKWPASRGATAPAALASQASRLGERAWQDREIVYFMNDPSTSSFSLYHDYTETRPGVGHYFNVVRAGSRASNASARNLDTGEDLKVETLTGVEVKQRGLPVGETLQPDSEVVVISFPPVAEGRTTRLRITETYTDPSRYLLEGDELVWDRAFGRPRNDVVLPAGWALVASSIPGVISTQPDGRLRIAFENNRPDEIQVLIRARRLK